MQEGVMWKTCNRGTSERKIFEEFYLKEFTKSLTGRLIFGIVGLFGIYIKSKNILL